MSTQPDSFDAQDNWVFDVETAHHDDIKVGALRGVDPAHQHPRALGLVRTRRVSVSREEFPDPRVASEVAACLAVAVHGGMPTRVLHCL